MTMTMDDDGAILVHLTNPGGIVGGTGVASQITYWTDTDTIGGDAGLTYDAATDSLTIAGHMAVGGAAVISAARILDVHEVFTDLAGVIEGAYFYTEANPAAASGATFRGVATEVYNKSNNNVAILTGQNIRIVNEGSGTATAMYGLNAYAENNAGIAQNLYGLYFYARQNAGGTTSAAYGGYFRVRRVGGTMTTGYGISIRVQGVMGTAYGLYISSVTEAGTNYAIYSAGGDSYHAGKVSIGGTVAPLAQLHVDQSSASGAIPVLYLDQGDVSEPFTNYVGTSAASAANSLSSWTTGNAVQGHIQIDVNGVKRWLRFYNDPTS